MHNANWDDLRYVIAVAETGSVSAAARRLGVNHATVLRRITAFEEAHGAELFERSQQGYRLRPDRAIVIEAAREAATALGRVGDLLRPEGAGAGDMLRLTSTDTLCTTLLARGIGRIAEAMAPHRICLMSSNAHLDLGRLQADLTVRPAPARPEDMAGDAVTELVFDTYARDVEEQRWLGVTGPLTRAPPARWLAEAVKPQDFVAAADSFVALREMARAGQGIALLPRLLARGCPDLRVVDRGLPDMRVPVWVLCHKDLAGSARMRRFMAIVTEVLRAEAD